MAISTIGTNALADGTIATADIQDTSITPAKMANGGAEFGMRNRLINGAIGIWQRGTSFTSGGAATYTADRFFGNGSSGTISRSTDVPAGFTYSFSNAASSTAYPGLAQRIESFNIADCASQAITVSFYVKQTSGTASALNINLAYPTAVDNYASSTTIIETNVVAAMSATWTRYSYTYTLPANVTNGLSVTLFIPNASITATFLITGVQLEKGSTATSFDYRPYGTELALCQRYYYKFNSSGNPQLFTVSASPGSDAGQIFYLRVPVPMRAIPTASSTAANTFGTWPSVSGGSNILGSSFYSISGIGAYPYQDIEFMITLASSPGTQTSRFGFRSATAYIDASAEL